MVYFAMKTAALPAAIKKDSVEPPHQLGRAGYIPVGVTKTTTMSNSELIIYECIIYKHKTQVLDFEARQYRVGILSRG